MFQETKHAKFSEKRTYLTSWCAQVHKRFSFVFREIWRALLSWNTSFEIHPFTLLPTKWKWLGLLYIFPKVLPLITITGSLSWIWLKLVLRKIYWFDHFAELSSFATKMSLKLIFCLVRFILLWGVKTPSNVD